MSLKFYAPIQYHKRCDDCGGLIANAYYYSLPKDIKHAFQSSVDDESQNKVVCIPCYNKSLKHSPTEIN